MTETDYINDLKDRLKNTQEQNQSLASDLAVANLSVSIALKDKGDLQATLADVDHMLGVASTAYISERREKDRIAKENLIIRSALDQAYGGDAHIDEYIAGELAREASEKAAELDAVKLDVKNEPP